MNASNPTAHPSGWMKSLLWLLGAVACFHLAYASSHFPAIGLLIFGYAFFLVRLAHQPTVRRAFYFGLGAGFLCYAPQLSFFWHIFSAEALVLWLVVAFWVGLFTATVCGCVRRWGKTKAIWLVPVIWTGLEYFRSELYYLKFSWLNIGYALPAECPFTGVGMYGAGFLAFLFVALFPWINRGKSIYTLRQPVVSLLLLTILILFGACLLPAISFARLHSANSLSLAGIQMEFPSPGELAKALDRTLAKSPDAQVFVLSEYTLDGPVPESLKQWCRDQERFLVVGGREWVSTNQFYNTAFVVGTNGEIIFQQAKCVPIQFFRDGLPARRQAVWDSPWGKIGICTCYDLSYTRVTDRLVEDGAQLLIVPTMDVEDWGRHEHELHARVAPVRAAEYGIPIFRLASSGISQAVAGNGFVVAQTSFPGSLDILSAQLRLPARGSLPLDRFLAPVCTGLTAIVLLILLILHWRDERARRK
ncbi:MAG TPA: nitrilase-related carbon-nitrogen hydrolase [Candidatus Acidoferrum sp.]|nr:nitrilase-related carbon-nitrogen hydrolase [Candidatus Acidoferrum sp.]